MYHDDPTLMDLLLPSYDPAKEKDRQTTLHLAAKSGAYHCVENLLKAGADVNAVDVEGRSALYNAIGHDSDLVRLFLYHGANPNITPRPPLSHESVFRLVAHPIVLGTTPLHRLVWLDSHLDRNFSTDLQTGDFAVKLKLLLDARADVNSKLIEGETPLVLLCTSSMSLFDARRSCAPEVLPIISDAVCEAATILLEHGASVHDDEVNIFDRLISNYLYHGPPKVQTRPSQTREEYQKRLDSGTFMLKFLKRLTEILISSSSLREDDLKCILSASRPEGRPGPSKRHGFGQGPDSVLQPRQGRGRRDFPYGIRRAAFRDLDWTTHESCLSEMTRVAILNTDFHSSEGIWNFLNGEENLLNVASFPTVLEKVMAVLPANHFSQVCNKLEHFPPDGELPLDLSEARVFAANRKGGNVKTLAEESRYVIFYALRLPRMRSIQQLSLPEALQNYIALWK